MRAYYLAPLMLAVLALSGCQKADQIANAATDAASQAPDAKPGLSVASGKLVLPAVKGNPGSAYFVVTNGGDKPVHVAAVDVAGAGMAMMHETRDAGGHSTMEMLMNPEVPAHGSLIFAPGSKHVMVMDLTDAIAPGKPAEMTLTFDDGDKLSTPLEVVTVGSGG